MPTVLERMRRARANPAPRPVLVREPVVDFMPPPELVDEIWPESVTDEAPATPAEPVEAPPPAAPAPSAVRAPLATLEATLARGDTRRYAAIARAASGKLVWVAPSRVSGPPLFYVLVTADEPPYMPLVHPATDAPWIERHDGIMATRSRVAHGGIDPDAPAWALFAEPDERSDAPKTTQARLDDMG